MVSGVQRLIHGQKTAVIYGYIAVQNYAEAIALLRNELKNCRKSRVYSLLGYCHYQNCEYGAAATVYSDLVRAFPDIAEYRYYEGLARYKEGDLHGALEALARIDPSFEPEKILQLICYIKYEQGELKEAIDKVAQLDEESVSSITLSAAVQLQLGAPLEAELQFKRALSLLPFDFGLIYNIALCQYKTKQYEKCLNYLAETLRQAIADLGDIGRMGFAKLKRLCLVQCVNLKAAVEFRLGKTADAHQTLNLVSSVFNQSIDLITSMNRALIEFEENPSVALQCLNQLLENPNFPIQAFANILVFYTRLGYFEVVADLMADNPELTAECFDIQEVTLIDALVCQSMFPEEANQKLSRLHLIQTDQLILLTQSIKEAQDECNDSALQTAIHKYGEAIQKFIPALMASARGYWNAGEYEKAETLLLSARLYCSTSDVWAINLAHCLFAQQKYEESIYWYVHVYQRKGSDLLSIPPIALANLCVAYVIVDQNEKAEDIIQRLETEEGDFSRHLCIVNLAIGTLYCTKNSYAFGISQLLKSFDPLPKTLGTETWLYAKRCLADLANKLARNMLTIEYVLLSTIISFLGSCEDVGKNIKAKIEVSENVDLNNNIAFQAQMLRCFFVKYRG